MHRVARQVSCTRHGKWVHKQAWCRFTEKEEPLGHACMVHLTIAWLTSNGSAVWQWLAVTTPANYKPGDNELI